MEVTYEEVAPGEADGLVVRGDDRAVHAVCELDNVLREDAGLWAPSARMRGVVGPQARLPRS